jgi:hypothetical protein
MATYANLIGSTGDIAQLLENDSTELVTFIPRGIEMAEQRIYNELQASSFNVVSTGTLTLNGRTLTRPEDITTLRYLRINVGGEWVYLEKKTPEHVYQTYPSDTFYDVPKVYAEDSATTFVLGPVPDVAYSYALGSRKALAALSVGSPTNWLTTNAYSLLLTAAMCECIRFIIDDRQGGLQELYEKKYMELLQYYELREKRQQRDEFRPVGFPQRNNAGQDPEKGQ